MRLKSNLYSSFEFSPPLINPKLQSFTFLSCASAAHYPKTPLPY